MVNQLTLFSIAHNRGFVSTVLQKCQLVESGEMAINPELVELTTSQMDRIVRLAQLGKSLADLHQDDPREWYRSLLRSFADIRDESEDIGRELAKEADRVGLLTPAQIADASRTSRAAIYKRRKSAPPVPEPEPQPQKRRRTPKKTGSAGI